MPRPHRCADVARPAAVDRTGTYDLSWLRTLNDWYVQYLLCNGRG